jgi:hypothetical protein
VHRMREPMAPLPSNLHPVAPTSEGTLRPKRAGWVKPTPRSKHGQRDFARDITRTEQAGVRDHYRDKYSLRERA